jgi:hypothetical protein
MNRNPHWLDDPDAPPTEEELAAAEALARALDDAGSPEAAFAEALRAAHDPQDLPADRLDALVERALDAELPRQRGRVIRVAFGAAAAVLAMAAATLLFLRTQQTDSPGALPSAPTFAAARSAQDLFDEPFPRTGGTSARVDRIASARERDLRANRYAAWGVR